LRGIEFAGVDDARPAPGVIEAIEEADGIIITPSNPLISIGPILAVPGLRAALRKRRERVVAVCPLVGGKSLKGPSDRMMAQLGYEVSAAGVARLYQDFCSTMVIDDADKDQGPALKALDIKPIMCPTVMRALEDKEQLARVVLGLFEGETA
jgi:LPPG:FO 2-phospho-L-lactate transferase